MTESDSTFVTTPIVPSDIEQGFSCGVHALDDYFARHALSNDSVGMGREPRGLHLPQSPAACAEWGRYRTIKDNLRIKEVIVGDGERAQRYVSGLSFTWPVEDMAEASISHPMVATRGLLLCLG